MPMYLYVLIILAGMAAGFINVLAGNGSLITLPILIFVGLPANVANATNRVGVLMQNVVGTYGFYSKGKLDVRGALLFAIPMTLGSILGARIAVNINEAVFKQILAIVMIIMLVLMFVNPSRWLEEKSRQGSPQLTVTRFLIFLRSASTAASCRRGWASFCCPRSCSAPVTTSCVLMRSRWR
jgi:uncharacterized protein